jgi:hypothetical protein
LGVLFEYLNMHETTNPKHTHTHPKQRRHFLGVSVFRRVHIQRTAVVNTSCNDSRKMKKVTADGIIKNMKKKKTKEVFGCGQHCVNGQY